jgi:lysophospholipase L1-like esterase
MPLFKRRANLAVKRQAILAVKRRANLAVMILTNSVLVILAYLAFTGHSFAVTGISPQGGIIGFESAGATAEPDAPQFALKDGDRVVFYGDSITEQRLYTTYVEHYCSTHYPDRRITFINTGWGGDKVTANDCQPCAGVGGLARIKRDLLDHNPTVVTLLFGMNDGQYQDFDPAIMKVYQDGLRSIIAEVKSKTQARIYVMTPTVYDGTRHTPWSKTDKYNDVLDRYSEAAKQIATGEGLPLIDLHAVTTAALNRAKQQNPSYTFLPDGVHPAEDGQLVMAAEILRAWGVPVQGHVVSARVSPATDTSSASISVSILAPLPWPSPLPSDTMAKTYADIIGEGTVIAQLTGLGPGRYGVSVDGKDAGQFTAEAIAEGLRVGRLSPQATAASDQLASLIRKRADLYFFRWRQIQLPYDKDYQTVGPAAIALDALIEEMRNRARSLGALHKYEITLTRVK